MLQLENIHCPTLLLDETKARDHIQVMTNKANQQGIRFRPHFKTHQSRTIGEWFRQTGVSQITCSSLQMADYFAQAGWDDILVAFPVNLREIERINRLASSIHLELLVESVETVQSLNVQLTSQIDAWVKVDTGAGRTGIPAQNVREAVEVCQAVQASSSLHLRGLLTHAGHTYRASGVHQIVGTYQSSIAQINQLRNALKKMGFASLEISVGDTPGCTLAEDLGIVDEIRPGNFVFFDAFQASIGTCKLEDIAVVVACPVVAVHPEQEKVVIYGGVVHLSSEYYLEDGKKKYGLPAQLTAAGRVHLIPGAYISALSQEHGILHVSHEDISGIHAGDLLAILPAHSCITVSCLKNYFTLDGEIVKTLNCDEC